VPGWLQHPAHHSNHPDESREYSASALSIRRQSCRAPGERYPGREATYRRPDAGRRGRDSPSHTSPMKPADLRRIAAGLEVPDCGCPVRWGKICPCDDSCDCPRVITSPPCPHVLAADHGSTLDDWAELCRLAYPTSVAGDDGYEYRPPPGSAALALSRQARVALYRERHSEGESLFHPNDILDDDSTLKIGIVSERECGGGTRRRARLRNGAVSKRQTLAREGGAA
jgi:hypothetical protein